MHPALSAFARRQVSHSTRVFVVTGGLFLFVTLGAAGCGDDDSAGADVEARADQQTGPATAPEAEVRDVLEGFRDAVRREDLEAVLALFSERYDSNEATGKAAVREWWTRVIDYGLSESLHLDLDTAELHVDGNMAEVTYYDENGELACPSVDTPCQTPQPYLDFRLERHDELGWLITGIPSEAR